MGIGTFDIDVWHDCLVLSWKIIKETSVVYEDLIPAVVGSKIDVLIVLDLQSKRRECVDQEGEHNESVGFGLVDKCFA